MRFDLPLFLELNEEYRSKPVLPRPPTYAQEALRRRGNSRVSKLAAAAAKLAVAIKGGRAIEIGCGRGETSRALATELGLEVVGVDIKKYSHWAKPPPGVSFVAADLSQAIPALGSFDFACSFSVWEHVRHPFRMLQAAHSLLKDGGTFYLSANLYRGPKASHRYRDVFFPWPHLLFQDSVFEEFYVSQGLPPKGASWINQLSIADYFRYFDLVGFKLASVAYARSKFDEAFYARFADQLERIPRFDLERDFMHATLVKTRAAKPS